MEFLDEVGERLPDRFGVGQAEAVSMPVRGCCGRAATRSLPTLPQVGTSRGAWEARNIARPVEVKGKHGQWDRETVLLRAHDVWSRPMNRRDTNDAGELAPATEEPTEMHTFCNSEDGGDLCMTDRRRPTRLPVLEGPAEWRYLGPHRAYNRRDAKAHDRMASTLAEIEAVGYLRMKGKWLVPMEIPPAAGGSGPGST